MSENQRYVAKITLAITTARVVANTSSHEGNVTFPTSDLTSDQKVRILCQLPAIATTLSISQLFVAP